MFSGSGEARFGQGCTAPASRPNGAHQALAGRSAKLGGLPGTVNETIRASSSITGDTTTTESRSTLENDAQERAFLEIDGYENRAIISVEVRLLDVPELEGLSDATPTTLSCPMSAYIPALWMLTATPRPDRGLVAFWH